MDFDSIFVAEIEPEDVYGEDEFAAFEDDEYDQTEFLAEAFGPTHYDYY